MPEDWEEISFGHITAMLPPEQGEVVEVELGTSRVGEDGNRTAGITLFRLPIPSPYLLDSVLHAARVEVDGADLVTAEASSGGPEGMILNVRAHVGAEEYHVQLDGLSAEDAPVIAHQVLAGLRVEG